MQKMYHDVRCMTMSQLTFFPARNSLFNGWFPEFFLEICPLLVCVCPGPWASSAFVASAPGDNVRVRVQESGGEYVIIVVFSSSPGHQHFVVLKCAEDVFYHRL